ncbi:GerAB/ArcD/ProY family transporter [Paenibacillus sp. GCM10023248]|uniref:GerAB/ArcD/ProY family transporter n=1 Tax=Bacillales TaxID=1385 RepID=UPI0023786090|nr:MULTISPECIES: GerAB/ArcD/ProY family transporter [Bacillales]MDD9270095.1 GerAB/ArcD/ProY family transporter [Paenibacillus sp. MAHUQ-63]MDR6880231.1 hypothetical protein [Bacillus sp. 3255]
MVRYFYYLVFLNMLANIVIFVPRVLLTHRFEGSMMSIVLSVPIGFTLLYVFVKSIRQFPQQGLPEILKDHAPGWVRLTILIYFIHMWFLAGALTLIAFSEITKKYINPDVSSMYIVFAFIVVVGLIARLSSDSVLYCMEILILTNVPIIGWVLYKAITNTYMDYDAGMEIVTHIWNMPTWDTLSAGTYIFTGYTNLVIFNRLLHPHKKIPFLWSIPIIGTFVLLTSFLIPIGYHGTIAVNTYLYPWISASDSMRVEFGLVERVLFIFILLYTNISLAGAFIHWHVGFEFCKELFPRLKRKTLFSWVTLAVMGLATFLLGLKFNDESLFDMATFYLDLRFASEIVLVLTMFILARRKTM